MIGRTNAGLAPLRPKYSIKGWTQTIGLSYSDLSAISEIDMRLLMSKHASVDYFMEWYASDNAMLDIFTQNAFAMKWIGLNDYIADKLLAISDAESRLLASPYWEYILKDHVPIMTSNTTPYGEVAVSNFNTSFPAYQAFDGDDSTMWRGSSNTSYNQSVSGYIEYAYPNPICVKRIKYVVPTLESAKPQTTDILFAGYNGTEEIPLTIASVDGDEYTLNNYVYVTKLRVTVTQKNLDTSARVMPAISTLQFYGRSLNVSVPTMTSNTQPYGEVISNGTPYAPSSSEPQLPYEAFDNKTTTGTWLYTTDGTKPYVGYDFKKEIVLKYASILANGGSSESLPHTSRFETSLDGEHWFPFGADVVRNNTSNATDIRTDISGVKCRYVRNVVVDTPTVSGKTRTLAILKMNFFGVDYSDRTERTYLYDHGVELMPIEIVKTNAVVEKRNGELYLEYSGGNIAEGFVVRNVDTTRFSIMRAFAGDKKVNNNFLCVVEHATSGMGADVAYAAISEGLPFNVYLDISSCNQNYDIGVYNKSGYTITKIDTITEWWLE